MIPATRALRARRLFGVTLSHENDQVYQSLAHDDTASATAHAFGGGLGRHFDASRFAPGRPIMG